MPSPFARPNWESLDKSPVIGQVNKGDKGGVLRQKEQGARPETRRLRAAERMERLITASERISDYRQIIDGLIDSTIDSEKASEKLVNIWNQDRMYMIRGGGLGFERILTLLTQMRTDGEITASDEEELKTWAIEEIMRRNKLETPDAWEVQMARFRKQFGSEDDKTDDNIPHEPPAKTRTDIAVSPLTEQLYRNQVVEYISKGEFENDFLNIIRKRLGRYGNDFSKEQTARDILQGFRLRILEKLNTIKWSEAENIERYLRHSLVNYIMSFFRKDGLKKKNEIYVGGKIVDDLSVSSRDLQNPHPTPEFEREIDWSRATNLLSYIQGDITDGKGNKFGHAINCTPGTLRRFQTILLGKISGLTTLEVAEDLAMYDEDFAATYKVALEAIWRERRERIVSPTNKVTIKRNMRDQEVPDLSQDDRAVRLQIKKMGDLVDQIYTRGLKELKLELGVGKLKF